MHFTRSECWMENFCAFVLLLISFFFLRFLRLTYVVSMQWRWDVFRHFGERRYRRLYLVLNYAHIRKWTSVFPSSVRIRFRSHSHYSRGCCVCIFAQSSNKLFPQNLILLFRRFSLDNLFFLNENCFSSVAPFIQFSAVYSFTFRNTGKLQPFRMEMMLTKLFKWLQF